jgi:uncharacterized protein
MTQSDLLQILRCPESHQTLKAADAALVQKLNDRIPSGQLLNRAGQPVTQPSEGGFVRQDGQLFFPIRNGIPMLLIGEAIPLASS